MLQKIGLPIYAVPTYALPAFQVPGVVASSGATPDALGHDVRLSIRIGL